MKNFAFLRILSCAVLAVSLAACSGFDRAHHASLAKKQMLGKTREDVLACMGIPNKKAAEGTTEVWSYVSTDGHSERQSTHYRPTSMTIGSISTDRNFCTVNVVMKEGVVKSLRYIGPTSTSTLTPDDQCGYAVSGCVEE